MGKSKNPNEPQPGGEVQNAQTAPIPQLRKTFAGTSQSGDNAAEVKRRKIEEARKEATKLEHGKTQPGHEGPTTEEVIQSGARRHAAQPSELDRRREELARKKAEAEARVKAAREAEAESRAELAKRTETMKAASARREAARAEAAREAEARREPIARRQAEEEKKAEAAREEEAARQAAERERARNVSGARIAANDQVRAEQQAKDAAKAAARAEAEEDALKGNDNVTEKQAHDAKKAAEEAQRQRNIEAARENAAEEARWAREAREKAAGDAALAGEPAQTSRTGVSGVGAGADAIGVGPGAADIGVGAAGGAAIGTEPPRPHHWQGGAMPQPEANRRADAPPPHATTKVDNTFDAKTRPSSAGSPHRSDDNTSKADDFKAKAQQAKEKTKAKLEEAGFTDGNAAETIDRVIPGDAQPAAKLKDAASSAKEKANSIGMLVSRISDQAHNLIQGEIELAKAKGKAMVTRISKGAVLLIVAGILALYLLGVLLHAAILGLSTVVPPWAAALIVAGVLLLIIVILALIGGLMLKKGSKDKPDPKTGLHKSVDAFKKGLKK